MNAAEALAVAEYRGDGPPTIPITAHIHCLELLQAVPRTLTLRRTASRRADYSTSTCGRIASSRSSSIATCDTPWAMSSCGGYAIALWTFSMMCSSL